mmetsp:Transcript_7731/g.9510  ORF Transcript_7731/g.9510 Transcript_7731/m.9510 type:complete len:169 (+) Transcript_7731:80-586(+)
MIEIRKDVVNLHTIQEHEGVAREIPGASVAKRIRSRFNRVVRRKKIQFEDGPSMEEILKLISSDDILWREFLQLLRENGVVTNFHASELLPSFINERRWEIEKLIRDQKKESGEEKETTASRMRSMLFRFGRFGDIRRRFSNDGDNERAREQSQTACRGRMNRRETIG